MRTKIGIVGAGHVGTEAANELLRLNVADIVLIDINGEMAAGKALDLGHTCSLRGSSARISGGCDYRALSGCSVVVVTAGQPRKPGMSRDELLQVNFAVIKQTVEQLLEVVPHAVYIMVTNPLDTMAYAAWRLSGKPSNQVIGMAGVLDAARLRYFLAQEIGVNPSDIAAPVLGSHGDRMVPLIRHATAGGIPVSSLLDTSVLKRIVDRTVHAGTELVSLLKRGSAYYAAGVSVASMVESIVNDRKRLQCASVLAGEHYRLGDVFVGLPVILGSGGAERIVSFPLERHEQEALHAAVEGAGDAQKRVDAMIGRPADSAVKPGLDSKIGKIGRGIQSVPAT